MHLDCSRSWSILRHSLRSSLAVSFYACGGCLKLFNGIRFLSRQRPESGIDNKQAFSAGRDLIINAPLTGPNITTHSGMFSSPLLPTAADPAPGGVLPLQYPLSLKQEDDVSLAPYECSLRWSKRSAPERLLVFVWNGTPRTTLCKVRFVGLQRWSEIQNEFVDSSASPIYGFSIIETLVAPEKEEPQELVTLRNGSATILGLQRNRTAHLSNKGRWRLCFRIEFGNRSRFQTLDLEWTDEGLRGLDTRDDDNLFT